MFNVIGGITWVSLILCSGYFFGNIPVIRNNFSVVVLVIIFISILPAIVEYLKHRRTAAPARP
jgi:membrane-associated protein